MERVRMYTTSWCGFCVAARRYLDDLGVPYEEVQVDDDPEFRQWLLETTGGWTVPQIVIDGKPVGGYTELRRLDPSRLEELVHS
jgi:glutaredoxin 3